MNAFAPTTIATGFDPQPDRSSAAALTVPETGALRSATPGSSFALRALGGESEQAPNGDGRIGIPEGESAAPGQSFKERVQAITRDVEAIWMQLRLAPEQFEKWVKHAAKEYMADQPEGGPAQLPWISRKLRDACSDIIAAAPGNRNLGGSGEVTHSPGHGVVIKIDDLEDLSVQKRALKAIEKTLGLRVPDVIALDPLEDGKGRMLLEHVVNVADQKLQKINPDLHAALHEHLFEAVELIRRMGLRADFHGHGNWGYAGSEEQARNWKPGDPLGKKDIILIDPIERGEERWL